ncbi:2Fe-2S iron-sulfur cluster-binding protein [Streptomyces sp. NPDC059455]|uniref:2Fe-2S iron-sulfur cluster-binding protein n=1 Tax=Streptomyces sp. NPDC059455 TaxID=3346837 RepID=UPI0036962576
MPKVHYNLPGGETRPVDVPSGESVMKGAVNHGVPGIVGECGGQLTCATCHVHVAEEWTDTFAPADEEEADLLDIVDDLRPNSRLGCQLLVTADHDGIVVDVPNG